MSIPLPFYEDGLIDGDMFTISNRLPDGQSDDPNGYRAASLAGYSWSGTGVHGANGQTGTNYAQQSACGVYGESTDNPGVCGQSLNGYGVYGWSQSAQGGRFETAGDSDALVAKSPSPTHAAVSASNSCAAQGQVPSAPGVWAWSNNTAIYSHGSPAGYFDGDILVTGDLILVNSSSGDVAEDFDVDDEPVNREPGTVLVINEHGRLCASNASYDTRVAGVVSGGEELKPAVVLQRVSSPVPRSPIALLGKVFCKVDATSESIAAGDLLTTSDKPGYAMKASDNSRAFGAVLGKALAPRQTGLGMIPILVSLR